MKMVFWVKRDTKVDKEFEKLSLCAPLKLKVCSFHGIFTHKVLASMLLEEFFNRTSLAFWKNFKNTSDTQNTFKNK